MGSEQSFKVLNQEDSGSEKGKILKDLIPQVMIKIVNSVEKSSETLLLVQVFVRTLTFHTFLIQLPGL